MKVAILTLFATGNMGALLQAFATQTLVRQAGHSSDLIYFKDELLEHPLRLSNLKRKGLMGYVGSFVGAALRRPCKKNLWNFIRKNLSITPHVDRNQMCALVDQYDFFLAGSDCIWNSESLAFEKSYLLDFVPEGKKGNYASSFATNSIREEYREEYRKYLMQFDRLSVREEQGRKIIEKLTGKQATVVLDPTLALDHEFWAGFADQSHLDLSAPYIFVAEYAVSPALIRDARRLSQETGLPLYLLYPAKGGRIKHRKLFISAGPEDFLALIRNAKYVLTDSYHVSLFSINFGVPFWTYLTGTNLPTISKYETIFGKLKLMQRIRTQDMEFDLTAQSAPDYESVSLVLSEERKKSKAFLNELLNGN